MKTMRKHARVDPAAASEGGGFSMTAIIDVTFLLIIFFMCVTELADSSKASMLLPEACAAEIHETEHSVLIINIVHADANRNLHDGDILIQQQRMDTKALDAFLHEVYLRKKNPSILIRADQRVEYRHVESVLRVCVRNHIWRIAFAAVPSE